MADLVAEHLKKSFAAAEGGALDVLADASLTLSRGESLAVTGPSGSGKSTLLSLLGTLDRPDAGQYRLGDQSPFALAEPDLARFRSRSIGFVFQDHHLLPQCSVLENALVPLLADGVAGPADVERARELLVQVGLGERIAHRPAQLSGGERQRAAIARALVRRPLLVLADEPTGNLDGATAERVAELLVSLQREQQAMLIVVTHSADLAAKLDRRCELRAGRLSEA
ncbi:MAG: ABC transporter ATP-binding protein [Pirellulales bacterium]|nr:ABC transporter ATP-binding protein [Pirellulales bacterium]